MQRKTYQSIHYKDLDTYVSVNGVKTLIIFRGGTLKPKVNGKVSTDDPALIKAMDNDPGNGTSFRCISIEGEAEPSVRENPVIPSKAKEKKQEPEDDTQDRNPEITKVEGISTVQAARDYLLNNVPELTASKIPNGAAVKNVAAANNILFVDLP